MNSPAIVAHSCVGWSNRRFARASQPGSLRAARGFAAGALTGGRGGGPALGGVGPRGGGGPRRGGGGPRGGGAPGGGGGGGGGGLGAKERKKGGEEAKSAGLRALALV